MINVVNKTIENTIYCPKNLTETEVNFVFDIHSEITNKSYVFEVVDQSSGSSYYKFNVLFDEVPDGEYNWYVLLSGETRSEGLIRIGNWNPASNGTAYHLIQYDAAGYSPIDLQTKQVEINSEGFTTVEPDNGFVGLKEVQVFVDVPNEYEEGYEDGEAAQKAKLIALEVKANGRYEREDGYKQVDVDVDTTPYYESGYTAGYEAGYESGSTEGSEEGYESGYTAGVEAGEAQQKAKLITTAITENGTYAREDGYSSVSVDVPTTVNNQNKTVEYTENGTYIVVPAAGYSGLGSVTIQTNVPHTGHTDAEMEQAYQSGYTSGETVGYESGYTSGETVGYASGKTDGVAEQKAKLVTTAVTENGTYSRADGYSSVTVNVPQTGSTINNQNKTVPITTNGTTAVTFDAGYTGLGTVTINTNVPTGSTINNQDKSLSFTANTTTIITADAGYTGLGNVALDINIPQTGHTDAEMEAAYASGVTEGEAIGYASGYTEGEADQKAKLITTAVTANGTYTREDGFSSVTVNVPTTPLSTVSVTLTNATLIGSAGFTLECDNVQYNRTFTGSTISIEGLLPGKAYTITYHYVSGYITPNPVTAVTIYNDTTPITVTYMPSTSIPFAIEATSTGTIRWALGSKRLEYKIDNSDWATMTSGSVIDISSGQTAYFRGDNDNYCGNTISTTCGAIVKGDIRSIITKTGWENLTLTATNKGCYRDLFNNDNDIISAENLIFGSSYMPEEGCWGMFQNSSIVVGPHLTPTTINKNSYTFMFDGCSQLTTCNVFSGANFMSDSCCVYTFQNCTSLVNGPSILPALTLTNSCYSQMFRGCTALTTAPVLPAKILASSAYWNMFNGCTSLNYVKCLLQTHSASDTYRWLYGVASSGTFVKYPGGLWDTGESGIPSGWTVEEEAS